MHDPTPSPDANTERGTFAAGAVELDAKHWIAQAIECANRVTDDWTQSIALKDIAVAQAMAGDPVGAKQTALGIADRSWVSITLREIVGTQLQSGDRIGAKQTADLIADPADKMLALRSIVEAHAKAGDWIGAKQTAVVIPNGSHKCRAFLQIAGAQTAAGDVAGAKQTLGEAKPLADALLDGAIAERSIALKELSAAQGLAGDLTRSSPGRMDATPCAGAS